MSCQGEPIEMKDLRTEGQQEIMEKLGDYLALMIEQTREPYTGQLNAPSDPGQLAAMNTMMGLGTRAFYNGSGGGMPGPRVGPAPGGPLPSVDVHGPMAIPGVANSANAAKVNADANVAKAPMGPSGPVEVNVSPTPFIPVVNPGPVRANVFAGPVPGPADSSPFVGLVTGPVEGPNIGEIGGPSGGGVGKIGRASCRERV